MTIAEKYRKVLEINKIKIYKAEDVLGFGRNTLKNAIDENRLLSEDYHKTFMIYFKVNPVWWDAENGDIIDKNGTYVELPIDSEEDPDDEVQVLRLALRQMGNTNIYLLKRIKELGG